MRCIFCRKEKSEGEFSIEHVFPEAVGGSYKIFSVCRDCNSELGSEVDFHLTDHPLIRLIRCELGLTGKKGNIRHFKGELVGGPADEKGGTRVALMLDKVEGAYRGELFPNDSNCGQSKTG